jgi:hypothetical protein
MDISIIITDFCNKHCTSTLQKRVLDAGVVKMIPPSGL